MSTPPPEAPCLLCGEVKPDAVPRPVPMKTVACDSCWEAATAEPDEDQAVDDEMTPLAATFADVVAFIDAAAGDPREGSPGQCRTCQVEVRWHKTRLGKSIALDIEPVPVLTLALGKRWRVAGDGVALNLGRSAPTDTCRRCHFDACGVG